MSSTSSGTILDWQQQIKDWNKKVSYIKNQEVLTDCEFSVGKGDRKKIIRAHKLILAMQSSVFEKMFFGSLPETDCIDVQDIDSNIFENMIGWMYTSKISFKSIQEAIDTVYAANKYLLASLIHECSEYVENNINSKTAVQCYQAICESRFKDMFLHILDLAAALVFEDPHFVTMKQEALSSVLDRDMLNVKNEVEVYKGVMKWANNECIRQGLKVNGENLRKVLGEDIIKKIRFLTFTMEEFSKLVGSSDLLTGDEKLIFFNCIACPEMCKLNKHFSANTHQRVHYDKAYKCLYGQKAEEKILALTSVRNRYYDYDLEFSVQGEECHLTGLVIVTYAKENSSRALKFELSSINVSVRAITGDYEEGISASSLIFESQLNVNPRHSWGDIFIGVSTSFGFGLTIVSFPSSVSLSRQISYHLNISNDKRMYCSGSTLRNTSPLSVTSYYSGCIAGFVLNACNDGKFRKEEYQIINPDIPTMNFYSELAKFEEECKPLKHRKRL